MAKQPKIYRITLLKWDKNQENLKKGHTHFLFSKRFFDDYKIASLRQNEVLLFVNCLCIAADLMVNSFEIHCKLLPNLLRIDEKSLEKCLISLQSNQLLTYEIIPPLYNRIEKNIIEEKMIVAVSTPEEARITLPPTVTAKAFENCEASIRGVIPPTYLVTEKPKTTKQPKLDASQITTPEDLEKALGAENVNRLLTMFDKDHIDTEFPFMAEWLSTSRKKYKNLMLFVMNWLRRSEREFITRTKPIQDANAVMRIK